MIPERIIFVSRGITVYTDAIVAHIRFRVNRRSEILRVRCLSTVWLKGAEIMTFNNSKCLILKMNVDLFLGFTYCINLPCVCCGIHGDIGHTSYNNSRHFVSYSLVPIFQNLGEALC